MTAESYDDPEDFVTLLYHVLLEREPDPGGLKHHANELKSGRVSQKQLIMEIISSREFQAGKGVAHLVRVESSGCSYVLPAQASVIGELASPEGYEPWVLPYFLELCRPGMTVLDIGASWGAFALPAAKRVTETGKVLAVEVSSYNCRVLLRSARASAISNLEVLPFGLSDKVGAELIHHQEHTNNNSIQSGFKPNVAALDSFDVVPVLPLDMIRSTLGPVHIAKIDIEGMEHRAMVGALSFFRENQPILFSEYSPEFQKAGSGVEGAELLGLYYDLGYQIEILHRTGQREMVSVASVGAAIDLIDAAWRRHVDEDHGTHLDLCLHPRAQVLPPR